MKPVAQALDILQGEERTYFGVLLPTLTMCLKKLNYIKNNNEIHVCMPLVSAILNGIQRRFETLLNNTDNQLASALHPSFKLAWLLFLVHAGICNNDSIEMMRNQIKTKMEHLVRCRMNECNHSDSSYNQSESPVKLINVGDDFFREIESNAEPQNQAPESHAVEQFLKETTAPHCERPSPLHFKSKILMNLFIQYNTALPSSAAVERLFSVGKDVLKPKRSGLTDEHFEMLVFLKGTCEQFIEL